MYAPLTSTMGRSSIERQAHRKGSNTQIYNADDKRKIIDIHEGNFGLQVRNGSRGQIGRSDERQVTSKVEGDCKTNLSAAARASARHQKRVIRLERRFEHRRHHDELEPQPYDLVDIEGNSIRIGAVAVPGVGGMANPDAYETAEVAKNMLSDCGEGDDAHEVYNPGMPVLIAHLPHESRQNDNDGNGNDSTLVVDGVRMPKPNYGWNGRRKHVLLMCGILVMAIVGAVVELILGTRRSTFEGSAPIAALPTSNEHDKEAIKKFLADNTVGVGSTFKTGSPHDLAAEWIVHGDESKPGLSSSNLLQRFALALFYYETTAGGTDLWRVCNPAIDDEDSTCIAARGEMRWLSGADECRWHGLSCEDAPGVVTSLVSESNNLSGLFPSALAILTHLRRLDLFDARIAGSIPEELFNLTKLQHLAFLGLPFLNGTIPTHVGLLSDLRFLSLVLNDLSGTIPSEFGQLTQLESFGAGDNPRLGGTIPDVIYGLTNLSELGIDNIALTGTLSTQIGQLTGLEVLFINDNMLSGSLPTEVAHCSMLRMLQFGSNFISGPLPSQIGTLTQLEKLYALNTPLSGSIPEELYDARSLQRIYFESPFLQGTISTRIGLLEDLKWFQVANSRLAGSIPIEVGSLKQLNTFWISHSRLRGSLPSEIGLLSKLKWLLLNENLLSGSLPSEIGHSTGLQVIGIFNNTGINGTIPNELFNLQKLGTLLISRNSLAGTISTLIGHLHKLQWLAIESNTGINGRIPEELFDLTQLGMVSFYNLSLTSTLSSRIGFLSDLTSFSVGRNPLTGTVPTEIGLLSSLQTFDLSLTKMYGLVPDEICELNQSASLVSALANCLPAEDPQMPCDCCTSCCDDTNGECTDFQA